MIVRAAVPEDAPALAAIYSHYVLTSLATFEEEAVDAAGMAGRLARVTARGWPWLVAEDGGAVVGYAYAAQLRDRAAYRFAGETSLYVAAARRGEGIGDRLLAVLVPAAGQAGFRRLFAAIGDSANVASIGLHRKHGFTPCGQWNEAGFKFGRWVDVVFLQRAIDGEVGA